MIKFKLSLQWFLAKYKWVYGVYENEATSLENIIVNFTAKFLIFLNVISFGYINKLIDKIRRVI